MLHGPGPSSFGQAIVLCLKGVAMGCADLVPGVSGGTIALITGIYNQLLHAVSSVNDGLGEIIGLRFKAGLATIHCRFLIVLALGIGSAIIGLSRVMHYLLHYHPVPTWGAFFGLIAASVLLIGKEARAWQGFGLVLFIIGTISAYFLVGMIPVATPEAYWFILLAGMIAICAMILPGISGAFLLLILGKYQFITGALKNPFTTENMMVIIVFCCGCAAGLLGFSRFLSYLMDTHKNATMAFLTGLMLGSMRKIWPWKEVLESVTIRGKAHMFSTRNILPQEINSELYLTLALAAVGFAVVLSLQKIVDK